MPCVSNKYVFIDFEGRRGKSEGRKTMEGGKSEKRSKMRFSVDLLVLCSGVEPRVKGWLSCPTRSSRVAFTLADINGFQPIRAKWNG